MPAVKYQNLPFKEAIKFFKGKVPLPTRRWTDLMEGMHSRAFVVAGAMKNELLVDFHKAIGQALSKGTTLNDFRKTFDETVRRHGWTYKGERGWRTAVIYNTNLRTAYATGHYAQMTDPDVLRARPYWRYIGGLSAVPRELHLEWRDTVLPANDPWWDTHYPPNGWGCKCMVVSASARELERDGLKVSKKAPDDGAYEWTNKQTGEVLNVPNGIDPGWAYNPGKTAWGQNEALRLMEDQGPWMGINPWGPDAYKRPRNIPIDTPKATLGTTAKTVAGLKESLARALGGRDSVFFIDPTGKPLLVTQAITDHILKKPGTRWDGREAYFPFIKELIEDPYEIWIGFAKSEISGRVGIRKKYVKAIRLDKNRVIGLWAETMNGHWMGEDFFRGGMTTLNNLRKGRLLWGRK